MNLEMPGDQFRRKTSRSIDSGALRHDGGSAPFHCRRDFEIAPRTIVVLCLFRLASDLDKKNSPAPFSAYIQTAREFKN